jgi:uncharacterized protein YjbI with pentapeptide repeats
MREIHGSRLLMGILLSVLLASCSSGGNRGESGQETAGNPHLLQGGGFIADASLRVRSYHTVTVQPEHHDLLSRKEGFLTLPYEILRAGSYKFCVPEGEVHAVSLEDSGGNVLGRWEAGSCEPVPLAPGEYQLHVENFGDATLFIKPHAVAATSLGGPDASGAAASTGGRDYMLLDLKKEKILDLVGNLVDSSYTRENNYAMACTTDEVWAVWVDGTSQGKGTGYIVLPDNTLTSKAQRDHLFRLCRDPIPDENGSPEPNVVVSAGIAASSSWPVYLQVYTQEYDQEGHLPTYWSRLTYWFVPSFYNNSLTLVDNGGTFRLGQRYKGTDPLTFLDWKSDRYGEERELTFTASSGQGIEFHPKLRYGRTTKMQPIPFLLAQDIALFDQSFDKESNQFPEGTTYWIVNESLADLNSPTFDSPLGKVKAIIVGRGGRARLYAQPGFQPAETVEVISPPDDAEVVYNSEDSALMGKNHIGSILLEPNTNTFTDYAFEHHLIVSGMCLECDLRGFNASGAALRKVILTGSNLEGANLSGANLAEAHLEGCRFTGANLGQASLGMAFLHGAILQGAELSGADLSYAHLDAGSYAPPLGGAARTYARATLVGARMKDTKLDNAHATGADFTKASWWGEGASGRNATLDKARFDHADLPGLSLRGAGLQGAVFSHAVLMNADLGATYDIRSFAGTDFTYANLKGANLENVILHSTNLSNAYISTAAGNAYVEVLDDVLGDRPRYTYILTDFGATRGPLQTDSSTVCPDTQSGWCGDLADPADPAFKWGSPAEPEEPTDCKVQDDGTLACTSKRHPK